MANENSTERGHRGIDQPLKEGYLFKRTKNWKRRYFVVTPRSFAYYQDYITYQKGLKPLTIYYSDDIDDFGVADSSVQFCFFIQSGKKCLISCCGSEDERLTYLALLEHIKFGTDSCEMGESKDDRYHHKSSDLAPIDGSMLNKMSRSPSMFRRFRGGGKPSPDSFEFVPSPLTRAITASVPPSPGEEHTNSMTMLKLRCAYERFVPVDFLELLNVNDINDVQEGMYRKMELTVLFTDIRSFTTISETVGPSGTIEMLNELFMYLSPVIRINGGFVDKFIGDAIMALFTDAGNALNCSVGLQRAVNDYNKKRVTAGLSPIQMGIGISTGTVTLGTVGDRLRMDATAIGNPVNEASRVESLTKRYACPTIATAPTLHPDSPIEPAAHLARFYELHKHESDTSVRRDDVRYTVEPSMAALDQYMSDEDEAEQVMSLASMMGDDIDAASPATAPPAALFNAKDAYVHNIQVSSYASQAYTESFSLDRDAFGPTIDDMLGQTEGSEAKIYVRLLDTVCVVGKSDSSHLFDVLDPASYDGYLDEFLDFWWRGLWAFRDCEFDLAKDCFDACLGMQYDRPSAVYRARCERMLSRLSVLTDDELQQFRENYVAGEEYIIRFDAK
ncbi:Adenylate and Guanylate cyclase catalytic domain [Carpediemonas membranifera]|uniref:Adenylate and Guanylate cyclase catalytic domain n=1 Tax=Carpediemonas membranifera TaxID=201153 RepID=A0A8J6AWJ9_9EUKA|nr:Adenylate and Guanylate cyclase catalytic domain [Carpediemonas membranifera]|eukprot:KAG9396646.1 Adenylate and Guanylate cyclase catalytic domain [Carpediemonas membranifera]